MTGKSSGWLRLLPVPGQCVHDLVIHHLIGVIAVVGKDGDAAVRESVTLTRDGVMDELAADFAGDMLDDAALFAKFSKENRTAAQKLLDSLKEFLNKVRGLFTGKYRDMAAQEAYGKDFAELEAGGGAEVAGSL